MLEVDKYIILLVNGVGTLQLSFYANYSFMNELRADEVYRTLYVSTMNFHNFYCVDHQEVQIEFILRPSSLSELTLIIAYMGLTHLGLEISLI